MPDLEQQLGELAEAIAWPATPDLRARVAPRLATHGEALSQARRWELPRWALAAAAVFLIVAALLAYTPTRTAIADFLNLHTTVHRLPYLATPTPFTPGALGQTLGLGEPTTLSQAQAGLTWKIKTPPSLGDPDAVYVQQPPAGPSGGEVSLVYASRPDIKPAGTTGVAVLISEARGTVDEQFFGKMLGPDTTIESIKVNGHAGWWISGRPHEFAFTDAHGNFHQETIRLATNTLIFDDNGTLVRIEADISKAQALGIAASLY